MNKLSSVIVTVAIGLVVLVAATPTLLRLAHALVPLVAAAGIVAVVLRTVWFYTR